MKKYLFFVLFVLNGCALMTLPALPIVYSISFITNAIKTPSYYNPNYIVTKECAEDATRAVISFTGMAYGNAGSVFRIKHLMSGVIHTAPQKRRTKTNEHWINYLLNPVLLVTTVSNSPFKSYPVLRVNDVENNQQYEFSILEAGSNLEINLANYSQSKNNSSVTLNGGVESIELQGCKS